MTAVPNITLNNGVEIPQLGFGVFQIEPEKTKDATLAALEVGYRHIDTARDVRQREGGRRGRPRLRDRPRRHLRHQQAQQRLPRVRRRAAAPSTAPWRTSTSTTSTCSSCTGRCPSVGDFVETWKAMEKIYESGRVKAIGVSNFQPTHLRRIHGETSVTPAVNQIEVHPYLANDEVRAFDAEHGIATEAWSPIAQGKVLDDPTIVRIAENLGKTPAQVTLRWHLQRGDIVFPKSVTRARVEENFDLFDFELSGTDMADITALDRGERTGPNPDTFNYVPE